MKKLSTVLGITLLGALLIVPGIAGAQGWGMGGGHMMGNWGEGPGYYDQDDRGYTSLNREQQEQLADLDRKFYDETRDLRNKLWSRSAELNALLSDTNPEVGKAGKLQKEISDLRAKLEEKAINHEIEVRKIAPDNRFDGGYGYGPMMGGYGDDHMRGGYGRGYGMGYGPGGC